MGNPLGRAAFLGDSSQMTSANSSSSHQTVLQAIFRVGGNPTLIAVLRS
jgi:hypothetical protein